MHRELAKLEIASALKFLSYRPVSEKEARDKFELSLTSSVIFVLYQVMKYMIQVVISNVLENYCKEELL